MDRRTLIAVVICFGLLIGWGPLLTSLGVKPPGQSPPVSAPADSAARVAAPAGPTAGAPSASAPGARSLGAATAMPAATMASRHVIDTPEYRAEFSSTGARLIAVTLKRYAIAHDSTGRRVPRGEQVPSGHRVVLAGAPTFSLDLGSGAALQSLANTPYAVAESLDAEGNVRVLTFTARDSAGLDVRQTWRARPDSYALDLEVAIGGVPASLRTSEWSMTLRSWPAMTETDLVGDERAMRTASLLGKNVSRKNASSMVRKEQKLEAGDVRWAGVQSRYFLAAVAVADGATRGVIPGAELYTGPVGAVSRNAKVAHHRAIQSLVMAVPPAGQSQRFVVFMGPSEYDALERVGFQLERAVDLGWNWLRPMSWLLLAVLKAIHSVVQNYGVAILLLAFLVRLLLHPLNMSSMKSMRAMVRLQPEMERIREKYKNDPAAMNAAVMALYRENKVNPAGGCLPLLMQMPVFFALFQVLQFSIELRQAPFVGWIDDLSAPDTIATLFNFPIHLLPIVMTATGLLQQALTPTPPQQASTAYLMNVIMLVFFYQAPSGLVLYWTLMNLFSAGQQWLMMRSEKTSASAAVVVEEPASRPRPARKRKSAGR